MSVNLQAAAEALTESAPGLPSPFERLSKSVNQFVGRPSNEDGLQAQPVPEEEELDMSINSDSIDTSYFADPGSNGIKLRGPTYLEDKKKVSSVVMTDVCAYVSRTSCRPCLQTVQSMAKRDFLSLPLVIPAPLMMSLPPSVILLLSCFLPLSMLCLSPCPCLCPCP